jgi:CTP:molybdopterin cytidylyltransferase MocA
MEWIWVLCPASGLSASLSVAVSSRRWDSVIVIGLDDAGVSGTHARLLGASGKDGQLAARYSRDGAEPAPA